MTRLRKRLVGSLVAVTVSGAAVLAGHGVAGASPDVGVVGPTLLGERAGVDWHHVVPESASCVQLALGLPVDGQYGPVTFDAVQAFQAESGLSVDGVVGPQTGDRLMGRLHGELYLSCYEYLPTTFVLAEPGAEPPTQQDYPVEDDETTMECAGETFADSFSPKKALKVFTVFKKGERASTSDVVRHPGLAAIRILSCVRHGP